jgi:hypothetical protein
MTVFALATILAASVRSTTRRSESRPPGAAYLFAALPLLTLALGIFPARR